MVTFYGRIFTTLFTSFIDGIEGENRQLKNTRIDKKWRFMRSLKMGNTKILILFVSIAISSTISQNNENELMQNINKQHETVRNEVECILKMQDSSDNPACLKPILRDFLKIPQYLFHYSRCRFVEDQIYKSSRDSGKLTPGQIKEHLSNLNKTLNRFRDMRDSLRIAKNTIHYIKYELKPEIRKLHLEQQYDIIDSEMKLECDSLKGILESTVQLTRRLLPPNWKRLFWPRHSPIIHLKPSNDD